MKFEQKPGNHTYDSRQRLLHIYKLPNEETQLRVL